MKLETLRNYFRRSRTTKLYVTTDEFAITGRASNPREEQDALLLDMTPHVICWFDTEMVETPAGAKTLHVNPDTLVTRRLQTHRKHLRGHAVPDEYLQRASKI